MPVIKSEKKKLRRDKKIQKRNYLTKLVLEKTVSAARKSPTIEKVRKATILIDKAAKRKIIRANKAGRIKSSLSKLMKTTKRTAEKPVKKISPEKGKK